MSVVLAVDVGTVRVGCASGDDTVRIPFPLAIWPKARGEAEKELIKTISDRSASALVIGLPLGMNGEETAMCEAARNFARRIRKRSPIPIHFVDESFSSDEAKERGKGSGPLDSSAACLILDRYFTDGPIETVA